MYEHGKVGCAVARISTLISFADIALGCDIWELPQYEECASSSLVDSAGPWW